jgi:predicted DNA-binding ArsR family transcriptional regulator
MPKRTRIVNDPADLVPLLQAFGSKKHKRVFDELTKGWRTEQELKKILGIDVKRSLEVLKKGGLIESQWRMPEPRKTPDKEYHAAFSKLRANFQCDLEELATLISIALSGDEEFKEQVEMLEKEVSKGNASLANLCRVLGKEPAFIKGVAKRSKRIVVKGMRFEIVEEI